MKYLDAYRLFESTEVNDEEVAELIEQCKDIIETFNESEDKFKVIGYTTGFIKHDTTERFSYDQNHESDDAAIYFRLVLTSDLSGGSLSTKGEIITIEKIDDIGKQISTIISRSKFLVQRLSRYCQKIYYELDGKTIKFTLIFPNPDKSASKIAKIERLCGSLKKYFKGGSTLTLAQTSGDDRFDQYRKLYDLVKNNPDLIDGDYHNSERWNESNRSYLQLRFIVSVSISGEYINISANLSGSKYKTYRMEKFRSIKLSNEAKAEAMKWVEKHVKRILINETDSVEISIKDNKIKIKVK